jgi:Raf kinase inhibitor-like YbhB/YbcL family protein
MRQTLVFIAIGVAVILAILTGLILINKGFTRTRENKDIQTMTTSTKSNFTLSSAAFTANATIPSKYTCDGPQISPPLSISGAPEGTKTFALIVEDPDIPKQLMPGGVFVHWVVFNIPGNISEIPEGEAAGVAGSNGAGKNAYAGPCPPPQYEPSEHRYFFTLYALDAELPPQAGASKDDVVKAMQGHILAQSELIGKYKKK